jgi:protein ImuB
VSYPDWPAVAAGCRPDEPAVVVFANRVVAATPAARAEGVVTGLRRREAQARCPEAEVVAADVGRDARAWEPVVAAIEALTPTVEVVAPGEAALATRGPSRYFGGDRELGELVARAVDSTVGAPAGAAGCRVGIADGRFVARLAAGCAAAGGGGRSVIVVERGKSRQWLAPHHVSVLGEGYEDLAGLLVRLGVHTVGDFARLPAPAVLGRFGVAGESAHRLARGLDPRPVTARTSPPEMAVAAEFDPPEMRVEAAAFVAKSLADQLLEHLEGEGLAATMVSIEAQTEHGESLVRHWRHDGALNASALAERARWQLEGWLATGPRSGHEARPTAGLTLLRMVPEEVHPDKGRQMGFWGASAESDSRAARAFARVQGLLGPDAVMTAVLSGGRGFAEQIRLVPWGDSREEVKAANKAARGAKRSSGSRPPAESPPWPGRLEKPAPAIVYDDALQAQLCDESGAPVEVNGRGLLSSPPRTVSIGGGSPERISAWAGPWLVEERWWDRGGRRRARIQVQLDGGHSHLLSREKGCWWVEATYD